MSVKSQVRYFVDRLTRHRELADTISELKAEISQARDTAVRSSEEIKTEIAALRHVKPAAVTKAEPGAAAADEPPFEACIGEWRDFYANRHQHYREILKEVGEHDDSYSQWYHAGGYGYDPKQSRMWIINETSIPDYRGTCLDIGSGDGFWTWVLAEWFHVTGIDPVAGGVALAEAVRKRLPLPYQRRTRFMVGDALEVKEQYDVVFCRAPSFFNYPIYQPFSPAMLDPDRKRLCEVWAKSDPPEVVAKKLAAYPKFTSDLPLAKHAYADKWREYLDRMMAITRGMFVFILSTKKGYYGVYIGDTYNHDPSEVERLFAEYGKSRVRMDSTDTYIVAEIYK